MCGIAGVYLKETAPSVLKERIEPFVDMLYKGIEHRGKHATGFVAVSRTGEIRIDKNHVTASKFIKDREALPVDPQMILLHTRYKTKGSEKDFRNNHPVIWKTCFTTHNGSISNDDSLFKRYKLERHAEVDSEIIPALIYESGFDIDKIKEYLDNLIGPMAMATINPTEFPGKLILAKTHSSPLHIINTKQMVLWASEIDAMREAWGKVFGTPPDKQKFFEIKNRTMLIVEDDLITKYDIPYKTSWQAQQETSKPPPYVPPSRSEGLHDAGFGMMGGGWSRVPAKRVEKPKEIEPVKAENVVSNIEIKETVQGIRAVGGGAAVTIGEKESLPYHERLGPWRACDICSVMVKSEDITTSVRGAICTDCKTVWEDKTSRVKDKDCDDGFCKPADFMQEYDQLNAAFKELEIQNINFWGQDEEFLHTQTLRQMADNLKLEPEVLDYLLFRSHAEGIESSKILAAVLPLMMEIYETIREQLADWLDFDDEDSIYERFTPEEKEEKPAEKAPFRFPLVVTSPSASKPHKCRYCRGKTVAIIERDGAKITYCAKHFERCCYRGCKEPANHTKADGTRVCHSHARNAKACWADTALRQEGYAVGVEE